ncbi:MAG: NADPH-dependent assimilatory sulfite reductase hemoprotein subunit [Acidimicrobiia bacterium]
MTSEASPGATTEGQTPLEITKRESRLLRGSIGDELAASGAPFGDDSAQLLKFHGIYQQDDRDVRRGRARTHILMVRAALPGGRMSAEQYLVADQLADLVGDGTLRITSRQGLQWHHVGKTDLPALIWTLNQSLVTTFGACGDVVRNVAACPDPAAPTVLGDVAAELATRFRPRSNAYWELWVDGEKAVSAAEDVEPIYGRSYLPRKFKIGIAAPGDNCVDLLTHDLGLVPTDGAWVVTVGGGQGKSHNRPDTYPRLADPLATVPTDSIGEVAEAVVTVQRDWGERSDRKRARLKYLIDIWGLDKFREAVEERLEEKLAEPEPIKWESHADHLGWGSAGDGTVHVGIAVESGRIGGRFRGRLAEVIDEFRPDVRFTAQQNVILSGIDPADQDKIHRAVGEPRRGLPSLAMACVALPTCGLALTDAERALPQVTADLASTLKSLGLPETAVTVRITGCPNGCARPYTAEIGLVGRRAGRYDIHLGGAADGTRLGEPVFEMVPAADIASTLEPLLEKWSDTPASEEFGEFCHQLGLQAMVDLASVGRVA